MNKVSIVLVSMLGTAAVPAAYSHGIWFAERATFRALIYGHGAEDLDMVKRKSLVKSVAGYDSEWKPIPASLRVAGPLLLVETARQPTVVTAVLDNGTWSKTSGGKWVQGTKDETKGAVESISAVKYTVDIRGPLKTQLPALPEQILQIVPVGTTIPVTAGTPITLRVLFRGKPFAGADVKSDYVNDPDSKPVKSANDGTVTFNVRNQGLNVIVATYLAPSDKPAKSDQIEYRATLTFRLPNAEE